MKHNRLRRELPYHLMLLPGVIVVAIFCYVPIRGLVMAFQQVNPMVGMKGAKFIGLENFTRLFNTPGIGSVIRNTLFIAIFKVILGIIVPVVITLLLNELRSYKLRRTVQVLIYIPHFMSWIILASVLKEILSPSTGIINQLITLFGGDPVFFLGSPSTYPWVIILSDLWKEFGFATIVYFAALVGIDPALYESAEIDGAGRFKKMLHISLPGMVPIIALLSLLSIANILSAGFDQIITTYSPSVYSTGDVLDTWIYRMGLISRDYGLATAMGLIRSFVSFALISISYFLAYKFTDYRIF